MACRQFIINPPSGGTCYFPVMLIIRLQRVGKKKFPTYRLVISEKTRDTQGVYLEELGNFNPHVKENQLVAKVDRIKYWISKGAQMSATINNLFIANKIIEGKKKKSVYLSKRRKTKLEEKNKAKVEADAKVKADAEAKKAAEFAAKAEAEAAAAEAKKAEAESAKAEAEATAEAEQAKANAPAEPVVAPVVEEAPVFPVETAPVAAVEAPAEPVAPVAEEVKEEAKAE